MLLEKINDFCQSVETEFEQISAERKEALLPLSNYIYQKISAKETPKIIVICTHNSRRSHMGQLWLATGAAYYGLPKMETYSGGTEATAFNPRAVKACRAAGFQITTQNATDANPVYDIMWTSEMRPYQAFSKKYSTEPNPTAKFAAMMVCTSADEGCPIVSGSDFRIALPFHDPKAFDDTDLEAAKYTERCRDIAREMLYVLNQVNKN